MFSRYRKFLFRQFREAETRLHELNYLFWECTTRCNLDCLHCGSDCSKNGSKPDMPAPDFLKALDTIKNPAKDFMVVLTGGEPLLRNDLEEIGRQIRKRGMRWSLVTNGHLYTPARHNSLLNAGLGALTISLDGFEASHNWLRNNQNSFKTVDNALSIAASSPRLNFDVVTCVNRRNINELSPMLHYLYTKGVKAWRLFTVIPVGRAVNNPDLKLNEDEFGHLMEFIAEHRAVSSVDVKFSCEGYVGHYETSVRGSRFFCRAGINIGSILADGSISACPNNDHSFAQGNIYKDNFFDVWQNRFEPYRRREWTKKGACAHCSHYTDCLGSGAHNWHGTKETPLVCHHERLKTYTKKK